MIYAVLAVTYDGVIGNKDKLPWHYPQDLDYYNNLTKNKKVLMGLNTYLSLVNTYKIKKFLYEKIYVVANTPVKITNPICEIISNPLKFLETFPKNEELYIVGGKTIYELASTYIDKYFITYILQKHNGDIRLQVNLANYNLISYRNQYPLIFTIYQRNKK